MADKLLTELIFMDQQGGQGPVRDKLNELGQRQLDLERGVLEVQQELDSMDLEAVAAESVRAALNQFKELYRALNPFEQKELMQLVLQRAEVNERELTLEVYALNEASLPEKGGVNWDVVRTHPDWLPGWVDNPNFFHLLYRNASLDKPAKGATGVRFYDNAVGF